MTPDKMPMVSYWKTAESAHSKVTRLPDGSVGMYIEGEKYAFPGFPRGHLLYGSLSPLKHQIKNQIFNESWRKLEEGMDRGQVIKEIKLALGKITDLSEQSKYEMLPPENMSPAVKEIHRAWTKVSPETSKLRDCLTYILQEDDAYRFRIQWLVQYFGWFLKLNPVKHFGYALSMLEHGEVIGDMKERQRLLKRILMLALEDHSIKGKFIALFKEIDWKKVKLTKGDKYHFRGKYFKTDLNILEY